MSLSGKQNRHLRGLGHHLKPVVQIGQSGITDGVVAAIEKGLVDHELIKVKIGADDRKGVADELAKRTGSSLVQVIGRSVLLYRAHPDEPTIRLP